MNRNAVFYGGSAFYTGFWEQVGLLRIIPAPNDVPGAGMPGGAFRVLYVAIIHSHPFCSVSVNDMGSSVFVAGHRGLVGSAVVRRLQAEGDRPLLLRTRDELDLLDQAAVDAFFEQERPGFVVLAAAVVGGILANDRYPADFISDNVAIQSNVIRAAHKHGVRRLVFLGSSCIYPKHAPQPMPEECMLTGPLEPTNQWYAVAKIAGARTCEAYRRQCGDDFVTLMPTNLYGPNDNFDPETSHVPAALLRRFHEAKRSGEPDAPVTLWGTGTPRREFLYVDDLADAIAFVLNLPAGRLYKTACEGMLNVGVGEDISIAELAEIIRDVTGSESAIRYDATRPDGTPRKLMDVSRMQALGWRARTSLQDGFAKTYAWYLDHRANAAGS